jgi:hypothetical protein
MLPRNNSDTVALTELIKAERHLPDDPDPDPASLAVLPSNVNA